MEPNNTAMTLVRLDMMIDQLSKLRKGDRHQGFGVNPTTEWQRVSRLVAAIITAHSDPAEPLPEAAGALAGPFESLVRRIDQFREHARQTLELADRIRQLIDSELTTYTPGCHGRGLTGQACLESPVKFLVKYGCEVNGDPDMVFLCDTHTKCRVCEQDIVPPYDGVVTWCPDKGLSCVEHDNGIGPGEGTSTMNTLHGTTRWKTYHRDGRINISV